jgi:hypothetical protein
MLIKDIESICIRIQPIYDEFISNYSKSYLRGSSYYVGSSIVNWWKNANNIRYFTYNKLKLMHIISVLKKHNENKLKYGLFYLKN